jgi:hypothetical protein
LLCDGLLSDFIQSSPFHCIATSLILVVFEIQSFFPVLVILVDTMEIVAAGADGVVNTVTSLRGYMRQLC